MSCVPSLPRSIRRRQKRQKYTPVTSIPTHSPAVSTATLAFTTVVEAIEGSSAVGRLHREVGGGEWRMPGASRVPLCKPKAAHSCVARPIRVNLVACGTACRSVLALISNTRAVGRGHVVEKSIRCQQSLPQRRFTCKSSQHLRDIRDCGCQIGIQCHVPQML